MPKLLDQRIALVTGASRGIGRAVALDLAKAGAHVIAMARTQGGLEELDDEIRKTGQDATLVPCDLKDFEAIDRLGAAIHERWGKLDILVGNAGVLGPITPLAHVDPKAWDDVIAVNVTANYRLIRSLDALLRASNAGRVVFLTSGAGHRAEFRPYWGPYAISKAGVDALVRTYAAETATTSAVKVMAVNPGPLRTRMRAAAMPGEDPQTLKAPEELSPRIVDLCAPASENTGALFDFPSGKVLRFQAPAEVQQRDEAKQPEVSQGVGSADAADREAAPPTSGTDKGLPSEAPPSASPAEEVQAGEATSVAGEPKPEPEPSNDEAAEAPRSPPPDSRE